MKIVTAATTAGDAASAQTVVALAALAQETRLALFRLLVDHAIEVLTTSAIAL